MRYLYRGLMGVLLSAATLVTATAPAPAQTPASPLSAARYAAIDQGYAFEIALERKVTVARLDNLTRYCATLDPVDPLLGVMHEQCSLDVDGFGAGQAFGDCFGVAECLPATMRLRRLVAKDLRLARKANRVLAAEVPAGACRKSLLASSAELRGGDRAVAALKALESGLRKRSLRLVRRALARLRTASTDPSAAKERKAFRASCGPAPAAAPSSPTTPATVV
jgi:hypothetical protein